jgi:hypothetical protein
MCVAAAIAGAGLAGVAGSAISASGAQSAADTQAQATQSQIGQQNYEFNTVRDLLKPYVNAGTNTGLPGYTSAMNNYQAGVSGYQGILGNLNNLTGANGTGAQQSAINGLQSNPLYTTSMNLGQQAILANASATGGLRGGNTIASLGYLPGQILSNVMQQQIGNLGTSLNGQSGLLGALGNVVSQYGNLVNLGENAASGTGQAALQTGNNITSAIGQQGAIGAGSILAGTNAITGGINSVAGALGSYLGSGSSGGSYGFSLPGATSSTSAPYYFNAAGLTSPTGIAVGG